MSQESSPLFAKVCEFLDRIDKAPPDEIAAFVLRTSEHCRGIDPAHVSHPVLLALEKYALKSLLPATERKSS